MKNIPLITRLRVAVNNLDTSANRTLRPEVGLLMLNEAYKELVQAKLKSSTGTDDFYSKDQSIDDALNFLNKQKDLTFTGTDKLVARYATNSIVPLRFLDLSLKSESETTIKINTFPVGNESNIEADPFNKGTIEYPNVYFRDGGINVYCGAVPTKMTMSYIETPSEIIAATTEESIVGLLFASQIVSTAALKILESWGHPRTNTKSMVDKSIEINN